MTRRMRTLIVLAVALAAATVASYGVYQAVSNMPVRQVEVATSYAVVAAKDLPMGTRLTADAVKVVGWPAKTPLTGSFTRAEDVVERGLVSAVLENEPITESKLAPREAGAGLPPSIPVGMRAMSVQVNEVVGVAGFVVPGTRVDVLAILRQRDNSLSKVVVANVQVLTAGTRYDQEAAKKDGKAIPSTVVTLLVTPEDAQRIALATADGRLMLALRNPMDSQVVEVKPVDSGELYGYTASAPTAPRPVAKRVKASPAAVAPAPVAAPPPPKPYTVEAIRAGKRTEEVVR